MKENWLRGGNSVNKQGRIMCYVPCPSPHCHLSIIQVSFQSLLYFPRYGPDRHQLWKTKWFWGDNPVDIQGGSLGFVNCPSPYYMTSFCIKCIRKQLAQDQLNTLVMLKNTNQNDKQITFELKYSKWCIL